MRKVLILGAGEIQVPVIEKAISEGYFVVVADYDIDAPGFLLAHKKLIISTLDFDSLIIEAINNKIDGILTTSDYPVNIVAKISKKLGLPAMSIEAAKICTNKYLQREFLTSNGFNTPYYRLIESFSGLDSIEEFPVIIKPVDSSASRGVKIVYTKEDLAIQYPISVGYSKNGLVIVESVIKGREFSVETFTQNNVTEVIAITEKFLINDNSGCFVEDCHIIPASLTNDEKSMIEHTVKNAISNMGINNSPTHTELKINDQGIFIIEIACRLGGDFITSDLVPLSTGVDMLGNLLNVSLGLPVNLTKKYSKVAAVQFFNKNNYNCCCEFVEKESYFLRSFKIKDFHTRRIENSSDRLGHLILQTDTREEMDELLNKINQGK